MIKKVINCIVLGLLCVGVYAQDVFPNEISHPRPPKVPNYMVFAGDTIRFENREYYERMDREIITFTYMHTNSTLMLKRAKRFFTQIEPILKEQGVPDDLKYLMAIESNLDPKAYSAAGAAGLWQFMKGTAQEYSLDVNSEVDERYHIEKGTVAACKYLLEAYQKYGNWMTVAASYNGGQNGISRRVENQRQTNALDLWMPEETSRYMYRILAAKLMFENPSIFGFNVTPADEYPYIPPREVVTVSGPIPNLTDFAEKHGVTYKQIKEANLWLRSDKLTNKNGRSYKIIIPMQ